MSLTVRKIQSATDAWRLLNGVFCVYKPAEMQMYFMRKIIVGNLCRDLNALAAERLGRPQERYVSIVDDPDSPMGLTVINAPNFADDPLAVGSRYQVQDVRMGWSRHMGFHTSGLCIMGVNDAGGKLLELRKGRFINTYQVHGRLGQATDTYHETGRVLAKSTYRHVRSSMMDRVLASVQASHQRQMYDYMGVDIQSQEAYEMASAGPVRPLEKSDPLFYGVRLLHLNPPDFVFEVQCINETEVCLMKLVHDVGLALKTMAVCTGLRQMRSGRFDLRSALLRKHWTLEHILTNVGRCSQSAAWDKLKPGSANLMLDSELPDDIVT